ncbi:uncharacterized protein LOC111708281 [Eurytemora carolleeae]|uniref:uncharacterized protein LOC111708281 n=1 Tax=Eurytemora carolleeae TaxID=1294199 RepID=UPI000C7932E7|nr:uncharacterized protein LOC111708281 [Eurytemora carolleeae]|eukprot:XP_023337370.1 uncharacterized protein LOC111708281 [Eurytemora affinis]
MWTLPIWFIIYQISRAAGYKSTTDEQVAQAFATLDNQLLLNSPETTTLRLGLTHDDIFAEYKSPIIRNCSQINGMAIDFSQIFQEFLGVKVECKEAADGKWGGKINGSWNGVLGMLQRNEIDVAMLGFMESKDRLQDFKFLHPIGKDAVYLISKTVTSKTKDSYWKSIRGGIREDVWLALLIYISIAAFLFNIMNNREKKASTNLLMREFFGNVWSFFMVSGWQMPLLQPRTTSAKILVLSSLFLGMMSYSSYSGVLVSNTLEGRVDVAVNTFQEAMDTDHTIYAYYGSIGADVADAYKATHPEISSNIKYFANGTLEERLELIRSTSGGATLVPGEDFAEVYIKKQKGTCDLGRSKEAVTSTVPYAFVVNRGFALEHKINKIIQLMEESGILRYIQNSRISRLEDVERQHCTLRQQYERLGLISLLGFFLILGAGFITALLILGAENIFKFVKSHVYKSRKFDIEMKI